MEMRILSELSRKVLFEPHWKDQLGQRVWNEVFEACGSPREWADYVTHHREAPHHPLLEAEYESIAAEVLKSRPRRVPTPVVLPDF